MKIVKDYEELGKGYPYVTLERTSDFKFTKEKINIYNPNEVIKLFLGDLKKEKANIDSLKKELVACEIKLSFAERHIDYIKSKWWYKLANFLSNSN